MLAVSSFISDAARIGYMALRYDDSDAVVVHDIALRSDTLRSGDPVEYAMTYSKRDDCHPPAGRGELRYYLWDFNVNRTPNNQPTRRLVFERNSRAGGGERVTTDGYSKIPIGIQVAGDYGLQWIATYHCARASEPQELTGPMLPFRVAS